MSRSEDAENWDEPVEREKTEKRKEKWLSKRENIWPKSRNRDTDEPEKNVSARKWTFFFTIETGLIAYVKRAQWNFHWRRRYSYIWIFIFAQSALTVIRPEIRVLRADWKLTEIRTTWSSATLGPMRTIHQPCPMSHMCLIFYWTFLAQNPKICLSVSDFWFIISNRLIFWKLCFPICIIWPGKSFQK